MSAIPRLPLADALAQGRLPLGAASPRFARWRAVAEVVLRAADEDDATRWRQCTLAGREFLVAQPVTFTPYAAARPCSARCRFCSENLRLADGGVAAATLRPDVRYFDGLRRALAALTALPVSLSLSGLENSDDGEWLRALLATLDAAIGTGLQVEERVLYSNGAGFAHDDGEALLDALQAFGLSWLELSRHHPDAARNQAIMRFRAGEPVAETAAFEAVARKASARFPLKLVCLLQRGGIETPDAVRRYLDWARTLGAEAVIFREFSRLDARYRDNATRRYVDGARVHADALLACCLDDAAFAAEYRPALLTEGYYFWNLRLRAADGFGAVFESSDYAAMHARHERDPQRIHKLVYFPNGHLCAGWQPDRQVLLRTLP